MFYVKELSVLKDFFKIPVLLYVMCQLAGLQNNRGINLWLNYLCAKISNFERHGRMEYTYLFTYLKIS